MTAEDIRKIQIEADLSMGDFSDRIGVIRRAVNFWYSGARQPNKKSIKKIRKAFKAEVKKLNL